MKLHTWALAAASTLLLGVAQAQTTLVSGSLGPEDPVFNRPVSFSSLSIVGWSVPYEITSIADFVPFQQYSFLMEATGFNPFLALYRGEMDPNNPLLNLVAFNDDVEGSLNASGFVAALMPGATYTVVSTAFNNAAAGDYALSIRGVVPEPGSYLLMALGLAMIGGLTRRRLRG